MEKSMYSKLLKTALFCLMIIPIQMMISCTKNVTKQNNTKVENSVSDNSMNETKKEDPIEETSIQETVMNSVKIKAGGLYLIPTHVQLQNLSMKIS